MLPCILVTLTCLFRRDAYLSDLDTCRLTPASSDAFFAAFVAPCALLLVTSSLFVGLIVRRSAIDCRERGSCDCVMLRGCCHGYRVKSASVTSRSASFNAIKYKAPFATSWQVYERQLIAQSLFIPLISLCFSAISDAFFSIDFASVVGHSDAAAVDDVSTGV